MLLLRFWFWSSVAHVLSWREQRMSDYLLTLLLIPYSVLESCCNLAFCDQTELVREGVSGVNQAWRTKAAAEPPVWVRRRLLALYNES